MDQISMLVDMSTYIIYLILLLKPEEIKRVLMCVTTFACIGISTATTLNCKKLRHLPIYLRIVEGAGNELLMVLAEILFCHRWCL